jgi:hypothetical protein
MSLENLLAIQRLVRHEAGRAAVLKLLATAVNDALLTECLAQAEALLRHAHATLGD